ncbi:MULTISPECIES: Yip1 family protein [unclassified Brevundimonas]|uniref:Yip1 family protein n=1 Tax=unclassified Brevundimonas TaxID=2622653 RepID=UPI0025C0185C|nr:MULTISPECIES: Yip1 family protein [unclassified Brevundimonas]
MTADNAPLLKPSLIERVKSILLQPKAEWPIIGAEPATVKGLFTGYAMILAAIGPIAGLIGGLVFGGAGAVGALALIVGAVVSYVLTLVAAFVLGFIIDVLAPSFGAQRNLEQSMKVSVYGFTPVWILGILNIVPMLSILAFIGVLYSFYLIFLGIKTVKTPLEDKAVLYAVVAIIAALIANLFVSMIGGLIIAPFAIASAMV